MTVAALVQVASVLSATTTEEVEMTGKADFSEDEWKQILEGPPSAALIVIGSDPGGSIRESFSMAKAYAEARQQHGASQLLDDIVSAKPEVDKTRFKTREELKEHGLQNIRDANAILESKASPEEVEEYKRFISTVADRVANARKEGFLGLSGERVSEDEQAALEEIKSVLA
ncbi:MAG TPA: hypothetical protein VHH72_06665 [Solirubrobacterales bacterium]|nr:hypothetical protein [Solirubrobacterales bacterium]